MAHSSFAATVLEKAMAIASVRGSATCGDISSAMFVQTRVAHKRLLNTLSDLAQSGRLRRVSQGVYAAPEAPSAASAKPDKREVMWRLLKIQKRVHLDLMVELAEVSSDYAREWLAMLVKHGIVKKIEQHGAKAVWLLLHDAAEMPVLDDRAARQRQMRLKKKETIAARLNLIDAAVADVRQILAKLEEE